MIVFILLLGFRVGMLFWYCVNNMVKSSIGKIYFMDLFYDFGKVGFVFFF